MLRERDSREGLGVEAELPGTSLLEELERQEREWVGGLRTGWAGLDGALGGRGLALGELAEVVGEAGSGKTQLCHQLCAAVQVPQSQGGLGGRAIYLDTEGSFRPQRLQEMWQGLLGVMEEEELEEVAGLDPREGVLYLRCAYEGKLAAAVEELAGKCGPEDRVRLVVVDSPAFLWRAGQGGTFASATKPRLALVHRLLELAQKKHLAVVLTNQVRARRDGGLEPCLGRYFAHYASVRVDMGRQGGASPLRLGRLHKGPQVPPAHLPYTVSQVGVRDPPPQLTSQAS